MASSYINKMIPYAKKAQKATNIDYRVVCAQWQLETGGGTSDVSTKANNHAGIKSNSQGRDGIYGRYASYNNLDNFVKDYSRVMNLSHYTPVRNAKGVKAQVKALHESPWAEDKEYDKKLMGVINANFTNLEAEPGPLAGINLDIFGGMEKFLDVFKHPALIGGLALLIILKK